MRKMVYVLLLGILISGCGTNKEMPIDQPTDGIVKEKEVNQPGSIIETGGSGIVAGEMEASLTEKNPLVFQYEVKNQTEQEVVLEFTSSQRFDYSIKTKEGKEVYLFSSVASFLQAIGEENVKQGESLSYEIDLRQVDLKKGDYVLSVWMTPKEGEKYKIAKEITVK